VRINFTFLETRADRADWKDALISLLVSDWSITITLAVIGHHLDSWKQLIAYRLDVVVATSYWVLVSSQKRESWLGNFHEMEFWHFAVVLFIGLSANVIECTDFHSLTVKDFQGNVVPLRVFKGKVSFLVVVITVCMCCVTSSLAACSLALTSWFFKQKLKTVCYIDRVIY